MNVPDKRKSNESWIAAERHIVLWDVDWTAVCLGERNEATSADKTRVTIGGIVEDAQHSLTLFCD